MLMVAPVSATCPAMPLPKGTHMTGLPGVVRALPSPQGQPSPLTEEQQGRAGAAVPSHGSTACCGYHIICSAGTHVCLTGNLGARSALPVVQQCLECAGQAGAPQLLVLVVYEEQGGQLAVQELYADASEAVIPVSAQACQPPGPTSADKRQAAGRLRFVEVQL